MSLCYLPWCIACYCRSHLRLCFFCGHLETSLYIISLEYVQSYSPMLKGDQPVLIKRIQRPCHCWLSQHLFTASTKVQNFMLSRLILLMVYDNSMQLFFLFFLSKFICCHCERSIGIGKVLQSKSEASNGVLPQKIEII